MSPYKQQADKTVPVGGRLRNANGKTIAAVALMSVMVLLWGRVLLRGRDGGPADAGAAEMQQAEAVQTPAEKAMQVVPVELPFEQGRHDRLTADIFSVGQWEALNAEPEPEPEPAVQVPETPESRDRRHIEKVAGLLKLEAIIRDAEGKPVQVFVNDSILTVGSVLTVEEGPEAYELVLTTINQNEVTFDWNGASITLKMTEAVEK